MKKDYYVKQLTAADLPPAVRPFWTNIEGTLTQKLAVTLAAIVCYCGLAPRLRVKYVYDHFLSMLLLNLLCVGHSGSGKSLVRWVVNLLMQGQILRDREERSILRDCKDENHCRGGNQRKDHEPLVVIRFLQKFTLPVVTKYADFAYRRYKDWLPFFLFSDEMSTFTENRRNQGDFQAVARSAFSLGETYSRDTLYDGGYNCMVDINWCSVICGQEQSLARYIDKQGVVLGDASRQILVKGDDSLGEEAPIIRPFDEQQERDINGTVGRLMAETYTDDDQLMPTHEVDMHWLDKDVRQWCNQQREIILKTGSRAHDSFYVRASVSAFRIATILYHLWGEKESRHREVRRCYWYFAQYILDGQMAQWGQQYEAAMPRERECVKEKPTLFDVIPKRFTRDMLRETIVKEELSAPARVFIHKWLSKKWICEVEENVYEKLY
ncbi:MAG: hypothetical protein IK144_07550 [Bacteroidaceae bacterium]|nr:hypothetical protein [Bacteroidaceae bacterium]